MTGGSLVHDRLPGHADCKPLPHMVAVGPLKSESMSLGRWLCRPLIRRLALACSWGSREAVANGSPMWLALRATGCNPRYWPTGGGPGPLYELLHRPQIWRLSTGRLLSL